MGYLFDLHFNLTLALSKVYNRLTGKSSLKFFRDVGIVALVFLTLGRTIWLVETFNGFRIFITLFDFLFGFLFGVFVYREERKFLLSVEAKYTPPEIVLMPVCFQDRYIVYKWRSFLSIYYVWAFAFNVATSVLYLLGNLFLKAAFSILLAGFDFFLSLFATSSYFYHCINDSSLYSRIKERIHEYVESHRKAPALVPVPLRVFQHAPVAQLVSQRHSYKMEVESSILSRGTI